MSGFLSLGRRDLREGRRDLREGRRRFKRREKE
jgi:hypothetical protein